MTVYFAYSLWTKKQEKQMFLLIKHVPTFGPSE